MSQAARSEYYPTLMDDPAKRFAEHLANVRNHHILFSGKFGKGKTTFLQHFFSDQEKYLSHASKQQYRVISLDPVNYSIAATEDIFRYIKYDIILELLQLKFLPEPEAITRSEGLKYYLSKHPKSFVQSIIAIVPKLDKDFEPLANVLVLLIDLIEKISSEAKASMNELNAAAPGNKLETYLNVVEKDGHSIYENDMVTRIITAILEGLKATDGKENVLIIDNLDRMDPEHIFRILNVFSTHLNLGFHNKIHNKLPFDKVIVVCDIHNIRNIFKARYGANVDWNGYIDKFYSIEIFHFQNYIELKSVCHKLLMSKSIVHPTIGGVHLLGEDRKKNHGIIELLMALIYNNSVSLRSVKQYCVERHLLIHDVVVMNGTHAISIDREGPVLEIIILAGLMGGAQNLRLELEKLREQNYNINHVESYFKRLVYFDAELYVNNIHYPVSWRFRNKSYKIKKLEQNDDYKLEIYDPAVQIPMTFDSGDYFDLLSSIIQKLEAFKFIE